MPKETDADLEKSPGDDMPYNWNFENEDVFDTDPIVSAVVTDWEDNPLAGIVVGVPVINSPIVQTRIQSGVAGTTYELKCKATSTTAAYDREAFLRLYVRIPT